ncbi:hypothetical protein ACFQJC_11190 [Haloferax namakaokahaiae]|uniref:VOC domain-containing protein n=1 Tax=Haloferax namakaokahaiae TaxID=1748331 RepID=A0ABD5ZFJ4_9EURY
MRPSVFHLHYQTPDVAHASAVLAEHGITPSAQFGALAGDSVSLTPGETPPEGFKLRLQTNRGGAADVTLAPGPDVKFDHFGVVVEDVAAVVERAEERDWAVVENERRTFLTTPWRFRIELQAADSDVIDELGDRDECELSEVSLGVPVEARETVEREIRAVVGDVSNLRVVPVRGPDPAVREALLSGSNVRNPHFQMAALNPTVGRGNGTESV